jgi:hypothetical protein
MLVKPENGIARRFDRRHHRTMAQHDVVSHQAAGGSADQV